MEAIDALNQVATFHRTFKHPIEQAPLIPAEARCRLRVALLEEELREFREAVERGDLIGIADALCDLQYVLSGAVLEFGLGAKFKALFDEVQRSNMSKTCSSVEEAEATIAHYRTHRGLEAHYEASGDHYLVYRSDDRKTLKSIYYSPPDLKKILESED